MKRKYSKIDIFKWFFSICIIAIHTNLLSAFPNIIEWYGTHLIFRLAVPFFFVTSGFFYGMKIKNSMNEIRSITKNYLRKLIIPYFFFLGVSLPIECINRYQGSVVKTVFSLLQSFLFYPWGALWYLSALMVAIFLISRYLEKHPHSIQKVCGIGSLLYLFALVGNSYYFVIDQYPLLSLIVQKYNQIFISTRNGIFVGILFVSLGILLATHFDKDYSKKKNLKYLLLSFFLLFIETTWIRNRNYLDDHALFIALPFVSYFLVLFLLKTSQNKAYPTLRKMSIGFYLLHRPVLSYCQFFFHIQEKNPIITFTVVLFVTYFFYHILSKSKNRFIKKVLL